VSYLFCFELIGLVLKIIVDAYNVLKGFFAVSRIVDSDKEHFILLLIKYAKKKRHNVLLIFDGGTLPYSEFNKSRGITIINSGYKHTADDVIKNLLDDALPNSTVLVTSDNELIRHAGLLDIASMAGALFFECINRAVGKQDLEEAEKIKQTPTIKMNKEISSSMLDELMEQSSEEIIYKKADIISAVLVKRKQKKSKTDRKLIKIIERL